MKRRNEATFKSKNRTQIPAKTERNGQDKVKSGPVIKKYIKITAENQYQKTSRKSVYIYQDILVCLETGETLLLKSTDYNLAVPIEKLSSRMRPVICTFDTSAGPDLIKGNVFGKTWLDNIRQRVMLEI